MGRGGFEPPKAYANRFTVCPIWPLWNLPIRRANGGTRTPDQLITNQLLYQLSYIGLSTRIMSKTKKSIFRRFPENARKYTKSFMRPANFSCYLALIFLLLLIWRRRFSATSSAASSKLILGFFGKQIISGICRRTSTTLSCIGALHFPVSNRHLPG